MRLTLAASVVALAACRGEPDAANIAPDPARSIAPRPTSIPAPSPQPAPPRRTPKVTPGPFDDEAARRALSVVDVMPCGARDVYTVVSFRGAGTVSDVLIISGPAPSPSVSACIRRKLSSARVHAFVPHGVADAVFWKTQ
ncbi:MAG: hypothetical protein HYV09_38420 [Deltaproteobacteria bacterium]|nr:hypothetical protein [Deltaproteobacteria bacterium]